MNDVMGIINLTESEEQIKELTLDRCVAAIPILGRYRIIDFALSNMANSGIKKVSIFSYGKDRSLIRHLGSGKHWNLDRKRGGLYLFHADKILDSNVVNKGDLENFASNLDSIKTSTQEYVVLTRSYMICAIDYKDMVEKHKESGADITIAYKNMENSVKRFLNCDTLMLDEEQNINSIGKNIGKERYYNISLEMYVMKRDLLVKIVEDSIFTGEHKYLKQCVLSKVGKLNIKGYQFKGYLSCVNSIQNYYLTNTDMLNIANADDLFNNYGRIYTKIMDAPSTKYTDNSYVNNSLIANGCIIEGTVENSILCRDVHIKKGSIVRNSVILPNVVIGETSSLNYTIVDRNVNITDRKMLYGDASSLFVIKKNVEI